ncbi:putative A-signal production regulator [Candidatus Moduliflexus flocculans]|uniref:histidine kinase n=1 Tax=Candidatus Moduliflexus flocculans TaxID=1499966 RepID=A0A081BTB8_9BACT|nr:putative A-signal production regulator [Candidatus Moduliflexus flocculans]
MNRHKILYIDDDAENLRTFKRLFRKDYEILLAESGEEGLQLLQEHAPISIIITDQRMPEMTGIEFLDQSIRLSPDSIRMILTGFTDVQALIDAINTGRVYRYITKPWDEQELYVTLKRAVDNYELKIRNTQLINDLQRKHEELEQSYLQLQDAQEKLIQAEKMASIGRLASRIAHELRNPIQGIKMGLELLRHDVSDMPECSTFQQTFDTNIHHINAEITSVERIVKDLLEYARDMKFEFSETDLNGVISGVIFNMKERLQEAEITVETHCGEIGAMTADGIRLRQMMLNFVQNSLEAMEFGGTLTIATTLADENLIQLTVQDTGSGMTPEQQQRIFEPFFTTKEKGVGLGMSIVHRIIEAHHGAIDVKSERDHGTLFTILLPRYQDDSEDRAA